MSIWFDIYKIFLNLNKTEGISCGRSATYVLESQISNGNYHSTQSCTNASMLNVLHSAQGTEVFQFLFLNSMSH